MSDHESYESKAKATNRAKMSRLGAKGEFPEDKAERIAKAVPRKAVALKTMKDAK